jgi:hypothetical protein
LNAQKDSTLVQSLNPQAQAMLSMLSTQGSFEMLVLLFKSVKQFITEEGLFAALESNQAKHVT